MDEAVTDAERSLAKSVAQDAMIMGWTRAVQKRSTELGADEIMIRHLLDKVATYNDKADPSGRIHELEDWKVEKRERSERASNLRTRLAR